MDSSPERSRSIGWQKLGLSILCVILAIVLILLLFATAFAHQWAEKLSNDGGDHIDGTMSPSELSDWWATRETIPSDYTGPVVDPSEITINTLPPDPMINNENVINILLIGQDRQPGQTGNQRSDSMILCSFNTETGGISMTSFLRDTYVSIPNYWEDKINAAYAYGGMKCLTETLATNFGIHVDGCAEVDFSGFTTVIDMLGGVDINLTQKEVDYMNSTWHFSLSAGMNHLNGEQALSYSRIRRIDMDAKRAERQRKVLMSLIEAYKSKGVVEMITLANDILDTKCVRTNMSQDDIINYVGKLFPMLSGANITSHQIPVNGTYENVSVLGSHHDVKLIVDMETNRKLLEELLG